MSSEMVALRACPFCGGVARLADMTERAKADGIQHVKCGSCAAYLPSVAAWNTRQQAEARATSGAGEANGWKLVPVEPTPEMLAAFSAFVSRSANWSAMLAAVPTSPTEAPGSEGAGVPDDLRKASYYASDGPWEFDSEWNADGAYGGPDKPNKGKEGGACNRQACQAEPALWHNWGTSRWYCADCARDIGQDSFNLREWQRNYEPRLGHPMFETRAMRDARGAA